MDIYERIKRTCQEEIDSRLLPFEVLRQKMLKKSKILSISVVFLAFIASLTPFSAAFLLTYFNFNFNFDLILLMTSCVFLLAFYLYIYTLTLNKKYKQMLKQGLLPVIMPLFDDLRYFKGKKIISDEELVAIGFYSCRENESYQYRRVDDEFVGKYKGYTFKISEDIFETGGRYPKECRYLNMVISNISSAEDSILKGMMFKEAKKSKQFNFVIEALVALVGILTLFTYEFTRSNKSFVFIFALLLCSLVGIMQRKLYSKFNKTKTNPSRESEFKISEIGLIEVLSKLNCKGIPQIYSDNDSVLIALRFADNKDLDMFEFGDINKPITNIDTCKEFCTHIALVYKTIDYIMQVKK